MRILAKLQTKVLSIAKKASSYNVKLNFNTSFFKLIGFNDIENRSIFLSKQEYILKALNQSPR